LPKLLVMLEQDVENEIDAIKTWVESDLWPAFKNVAAQIEHDAVAIILPDIEAALKTIVADPLALASPSGWLAALASLAQVFVSDASKIASASGADVAAAAITVLSNMQASSGAAQPAPPAAS